jgi:prephenate dehydrogenase
MSFKKPKTIAIIGGAGQMGKMFAKVFRSQNYKVLIASRKTKLSPPDAVKKADVVIISVPIEKTIQVIKRLAPLIKKDALLTDFTSIKTPAMRAMLRYSKCEVIGGHPLFGKIQDLRGQNFILCPTKRNSQYLKWFESVLKKAKLKTHISTPKQHDRAMAITQCLLNFNLLATTLTIKNLKAKNLDSFSTLKFSIFHPLLERLSYQNPELYYQIQVQNPHSLKTIKKFIKNSKKIYKILRKKDRRKFLKLFNAIKETPN